MVITYPEIEPEAMLAVPDTIKGYIETAGGTVIKSSNESPWGRRRLAYPIRHESRDVRDGFYTLMYFEAEPEQISEHRARSQAQRAVAPVSPAPS